MIKVTPQDEFKALERIQECASNPGLWPEAIRQIERSCNNLCYLIELTSDGLHTERFCSSEAAADLLHYLRSTWVDGGEDTQSFLMRQAPVSYPFCKIAMTGLDPMTVDDGIAFADRGLREWPGLITPLVRDDEHVVLFCCLWPSISASVIRPEDVMPTFVRLGKAVSSSLQSNKELNRKAEQNSALLAFASAQTLASCLVDTEMSIRFKTTPFERILKEGDIFASDGIRLHPVRKDVETAFAGLMDGAADRMEAEAPPPDRHHAILPKQSLLLMRKNESLCQVILRQVTAGKTETKAAYRTENEHNKFVLIEVREPLVVSSEVKRILQSAFNLSNSEARLAFDLSACGALSETLERLDITRNTAKTHLRRIYEKTGTQSQLELSRLIHSLAGML